MAQRESVRELIVSAGEGRLGDALGENDSHGAADHPARAQRVCVLVSVHRRKTETLSSFGEDNRAI